jgi:hypothetical protein
MARITEWLINLLVNYKAARQGRQSRVGKNFAKGKNRVPCSRSREHAVQQKVVDQRSWRHGHGERGHGTRTPKNTL